MWLTGCSSETPGEPHAFLSDDPTRIDENRDTGSPEGGDSAGASTGSGGGGTGEGGAGPDTNTDPERAIAEADVIQVVGDRLYALSRFSGLTILDVGGPSLAILGQEKLGGEPFEMYVQGNVVYAMFRNWGEYVEVDGSWQWVTTSHVAALDVTDPTDIDTIGQLAVPGYLSDSRLVGDVLYTVSFEDGYCWDCDIEPRTNVTSFDASDPVNFAKLDELAIVDSGYSWGYSRSISVTQDRIYVGGMSNETTSSIHVVDIADPDGALAKGATIAVAGRIQSRWQMDEFEGVLRVISQPWDWSVNPKVETFTVASSSQVTPLGSTELVIPQPESLRAVRFDGAKAYAITAEQVDPLFTIDLSNPAAPVQRGELEIPGWVYHIEPRGDRLLTLGFDNANPEGSLHVSLFDVANLDAPTLLARVPFGGDWGNFAEDQDRIHKAFTILPDLDLLAVPFSAWTWDEGYCSSYESGIQLVDWANDTLTKRGVAPMRGDARRALVHDGKLFGMSDEQVRVFDLADRDVPAKVDELQLAAHVTQTVVVGDLVARLAADWWSTEPRLELVPAATPEQAAPLGALSLAAVLAELEQNDACYLWSGWNVRLFAHGDTVILVWPALDGLSARLVTVDVSNPAEPAVLAHLDVPVDAYNYGGYSWYAYGQVVVSAGDSVVQNGARLYFQQIDFPTDAWGYPMYWEPGATRTGQVRVVDVSNPAQPLLTGAVPLPEAAGHTGLVVSGERVLFSHWVPEPSMPGKARFYLDRLVSLEPLGAALLPPINVPGSLVLFDAPSSNLLTVDYVRETIAVANYEHCYEQRGWNAYFEPIVPDEWSGPGTCTSFDRAFKAVAIDEAADEATLLDELELASHAYASNLVTGEDRAFFVTNDWSYDTGMSTSEVYVVGGVRAGELDVATRDLDETYWANPIAADGDRLVAMSWPGAIVTVDSSDLDALAITKVSDLPWWVSDVTFDDDRLLLALGPYGLESVDLGANTN
jgi:hypothetical protein